MALTYARESFQLTYQVCPIILTGGIADQMVGGMMPIISFTNALSFAQGTLAPAINPDGSLVGLDDFFAVYQPIPGSSLISQKIALYPFANQYVAANAVIFEPLTISLIMICPARNPGDYPAKLGIMTALQATLSAHNQAGGMYTIATPSFMYTNCVMLDMTDVSRHDSNQVQNAWQLDFIQPLVTGDQAAGAMNNLMAAVSSGTPTDGSLSGGGANVGNTANLVGSSTVSAQSGTGGSGVAGFGPR